MKEKITNNNRRTFIENPWDTSHIAQRRHEAAAPTGYTYIGPCKCGKEADALYQDSNGKIIHAWELYQYDLPILTKEAWETELEILKEEKAQLEKRIEEIERQIKQQNNEV
ncbi:MAG: DUF5320 domain-containing protein [Bacteroidia bacterium]|nr:DUF5320 domain-containing protein [Bacteroidia bacterium]